MISSQKKQFIKDNQYLLDLLLSYAQRRLDYFPGELLAYRASPINNEAYIWVEEKVDRIELGYVHKYDSYTLNFSTPGREEFEYVFETNCMHDITFDSLVEAFACADEEARFYTV